MAIETIGKKPALKDIPKEKLFWGNGGEERRNIQVNAPGVLINGQLILGTFAVTYDERDQIMAMLSARTTHELKARLGDKEAEQLRKVMSSGAVHEQF